MDQLLVREPDSRCQKQRYNHCARIKCQHMLKPINCQTLRRKNLVHGVDGAGRLNPVATLSMLAIF